MEIVLFDVIIFCAAMPAHKQCTQCQHGGRRAVWQFIFSRRDQLQRGHFSVREERRVAAQGVMRCAWRLSVSM
eukprot:11324822-Karenia_brevis.AAC.1